jgi:P27 family predicted phage terminase small subunit
MAKPGPKTTADLLAAVPASNARMRAPDHLNYAQAEEWQAIVDSLPADYFRPADAPLLAAYCISSSFHKQAAKDLETNGFYERSESGRCFPNPASAIMNSAACSMAQLAVKLRLCPSSRYSDQKAKTKAGPRAAPARPWEKAA